MFNNDAFLGFLNGGSCGAGCGGRLPRAIAASALAYFFTPLVAAFIVKGVRALRNELRAHPIRSTALGAAALGIAGYQLLMSIFMQRLELFDQIGRDEIGPRRHDLPELDEGRAELD